MSRGLLLLTAICAGCGGPERGEAARDGRHDDLWEVVSINDRPAPPRYLLRIRAGRVVGGVDGCNSWGFDETQPPAPNGTRTILSDAMHCSQTAQRRAYWAAIGNGNVLPVPKDGNLRLSAADHQIVARRAPD